MDSKGLTINWISSLSRESYLIPSPSRGGPGRGWVYKAIRMFFLAK
jgi:hypothetical protein